MNFSQPTSPHQILKCKECRRSAYFSLQQIPASPMVRNTGWHLLHHHSFYPARRLPQVPVHGLWKIPIMCLPAAGRGPWESAWENWSEYQSHRIAVALSPMPTRF